MKIAVDVMGFENEISEAIFACQSFVNFYQDVEIILVGDETKIRPFLQQSNNRISILHTDQFIS